MITVFRGDFVYKYDGEMGTIEKWRGQGLSMVFLSDVQVELCNRSNTHLDAAIFLYFDYNINSDQSIQA
tara:strand:+ start:996 stop:1202 length:207 start_codon:yes stop_codon:yes gene_type:complete